MRSKLVIVEQGHSRGRPVKREEVCQHWMIPQDVWSGGQRAYRCTYCGKTDWRNTVR